MVPKKSYRIKEGEQLSVEYFVKGSRTYHDGTQLKCSGKMNYLDTGIKIYFLLTAIWLVTMAKALVMGVCLNGGDVITDIYSGVVLMM